MAESVGRSSDGRIEEQHADDKETERSACEESVAESSDTSASFANISIDSLDLSFKLAKISLNESEEEQHPKCEKPRITALVYDATMMKHKIISAPSHVEDPERIRRIYEMMQTDGVVDRCLVVGSRDATVDELSFVHDMNYVELLEEMSTKSKSEMESFERQFNSIFFCPDSFKCAKLAAGSLLKVVEAILTNKAENGVAVIRPPGHHAESDYAYGFCFFNNVAVAAKYAQLNFDVKRILIVDWDIHHGNGTQNAFYDKADVLYVSLHRYDNGYFFPVKSNSNYDDIGEGMGKGFNVNIPWNKRKMGDAEYLAAFQQIIIPIGEEYQPDLILVSAGFDAAEGDPLGGYKVTPSCYASMTRQLMNLAQGRVVLALEGGYNLTSISRSMTACARVLLGDEPPKLRNYKKQPCTEAVESINNVVSTLRPYWKCLRKEDENLPIDSRDDSVIEKKIGEYVLLSEEKIELEF